MTIDDYHNHIAHYVLRRRLRFCRRPTIFFATIATAIATGRMSMLGTAYCSLPTATGVELGEGLRR